MMGSHLYPQVAFVFGRPELELLSTPGQVEQCAPTLRRFLTETVKAAEKSRQDTYLLSVGYPGYTGQVNRHVVAELASKLVVFPSQRFETAAPIMPSASQVGSVWRCFTSPTAPKPFPKIACVVDPDVVRLVTTTSIGGPESRLMRAMVTSVEAAAATVGDTAYMVLYDRQDNTRYTRIEGTLEELGRLLAARGVNPLPPSEPLVTEFFCTAQRAIVLRGFTRVAVVGALCLIVGRLMFDSPRSA